MSRKRDHSPPNHRSTKRQRMVDPTGGEGDGEPACIMTSLSARPVAGEGGGGGGHGGCPIISIVPGAGGERGTNIAPPGVAALDADSISQIVCNMAHDPSTVETEYMIEGFSRFRPVEDPIGKKYIYSLTLHFRFFGNGRVYRYITMDETTDDGLVVKQTTIVEDDLYYKSLKDGLTECYLIASLKQEESHGLHTKMVKEGTRLIRVIEIHDGTSWSNSVRRFKDFIPTVSLRTGHPGDLATTLVDPIHEARTKLRYNISCVEKHHNKNKRMFDNLRLSMSSVSYASGSISELPRRDMVTSHMEGMDIYTTRGKKNGIVTRQLIANGRVVISDIVYVDDEGITSIILAGTLNNDPDPDNPFNFDVEFTNCDGEPPKSSRSALYVPSTPIRRNILLNGEIIATDYIIGDYDEKSPSSGGGGIASAEPPLPQLLLLNNMPNNDSDSDRVLCYSADEQRSAVDPEATAQPLDPRTLAAVAALRGMMSVDEPIPSESKSIAEMCGMISESYKPRLSAAGGEVAKAVTNNTAQPLDAEASSRSLAALCEMIVESSNYSTPSATGGVKQATIHEPGEFGTKTLTFSRDHFSTIASEIPGELARRDHESIITENNDFDDDNYLLKKRVLRERYGKRHSQLINGTNWFEFIYFKMSKLIDILEGAVTVKLKYDLIDKYGDDEIIPFDVIISMVIDGVDSHISIHWGVGSISAVEGDPSNKLGFFHLVYGDRLIYCVFDYDWENGKFTVTYRDPNTKGKFDSHFLPQELVNKILDILALLNSPDFWPFTVDAQALPRATSSQAKKHIGGNVIKKSRTKRSIEVLGKRTRKNNKKRRTNKIGKINKKNTRKNKK